MSVEKMSDIKPPACGICKKDHHNTENHQDGCVVCGNPDIFLKCWECNNLVCIEHDIMVDVDRCGMESEDCVCTFITQENIHI